ncbi:transcriptional regulator with XRE-family HTH domain [Negativicoccus succinicivorans]|uniref:Transcriptional regulator with XRE-family HTH domain n=1 Tax=Negativicoccus succinicivorans TaxID=620903 RepID=A0A841R4B0_9FIRM|nr:helix-turn-helix transcriptional regulator [Negativicoccus succinicivorans]MBB6478007.1 transcriptional regulator with XRE-family HTH domain [Negativicoccus succinicivorans]
MKIKDILKARRLSLGLTLEDVAAKVGVSAATISRWESGDIANMRRDRIVALSKALKISPAVIMGWDDPEDKPVAPSDRIDPEVTKMAEEVQNISDEKAKNNVIRLNRLAIKSPDKVAALLKIFEPAEPTEDMPDDDDFNE